MATNTTVGHQLPADPPPVIIGSEGVPSVAPAKSSGEPAPAPSEPEDDFSRMFAEFAKAEVALAPPAPGEPAPAAPVASAPAASAPAAPAPEDHPAPAAPAAPVPVPDPMERLATILESRTPAPAPAPAPALPSMPAFFSPEEAGALSEFYKEWPEIARAQELALRAAVHQTTNHVFSEVARVLGPKLQLLDSLANNQQYDYLEKRVPDYATITDKVAEWVDTQPRYLKEAFTGVMQSGTPDEVEDLIQRYRQATGAPSPQPGNSQAGGQANQSSARAQPLLSPAANKAAARLAPVNGKLTGQPVGTPQTFEDAFDTFARSA